MDDLTRQAVFNSVEMIAFAIENEGAQASNGASRQTRPVDSSPYVRVPIGTSLAEVERWMLIATLRQCGGNKTRAAATLGLSLKTLYNRLHAYREEDSRNVAAITMEAAGDAA